MESSLATKTSPGFSLFPNLPAELQIKIWRMAIPRGRIIRTKVDVETGVFNAKRTLSIIGPYSTVPTILHVCRLSRQIGLEIFKKGVREGAVPKGFYWNPEIDTLYLLHSDDWWKFLFADDLHTIIPDVQHLAIPLTRDHFRQTKKGPPLDRPSPFTKFLHRFQKLESISFLVEPYEDWVGVHSRSLIGEDEIRLWGGMGRSRNGATSVTFQEPFDFAADVWKLGRSFSHVVERLEVALEHFREACDQAWSPPKVELFVLGFLNFKQNGFCISPPAGPAPEWDYNRICGRWVDDGFARVTNTNY